MPSCCCGASLGKWPWLNFLHYAVGRVNYGCEPAGGELLILSEANRVRTVRGLRVVPPTSSACNPSSRRAAYCDKHNLPGKYLCTGGKQREILKSGVGGPAISSDIPRFFDHVSRRLLQRGSSTTAARKRHFRTELSIKVCQGNI